MEYTVMQLARLAGVSARTLRYYDKIGLLSPAAVGDNGYRSYGPAQVDALQQILFYRELGMPLKEIKKTIRSADFDRLQALRAHLQQLETQQERLARLISNAKKTILKEEGAMMMNDNEKFEGFKRQLVRENDAAYGQEARRRYGKEAVEASNEKLLGLTPPAQYDDMQAAEKELKARLSAAVLAGISPQSPEGRTVAAAHRRWLEYTWDRYTPLAHRGLAQMYTAGRPLHCLLRQ